MLGFALADTSGDGRAFRNPDAVLVLLECGDEFHELNLTRKFKVSRVDGGGGLGPAFAGSRMRGRIGPATSRMRGTTQGLKRLSEGDGIDGIRLNILLEQVEISVELVAKGGIFHGGVGSQRVIFISIEKKKEIVLGHGQKVDHPLGA